MNQYNSSSSKHPEKFSTSTSFFLSSYRHSLYSCLKYSPLRDRWLQNKTSSSPVALFLRDILSFSGQLYRQRRTPYTYSVVSPIDCIPFWFGFRSVHTSDIVFLLLLFAFSCLQFIIKCAVCPLPIFLWECYLKNDSINSGDPLIRKRAKSDMIMSTMRLLRETMHVFLLKRPNQCRWIKLLRSIPWVSRFVWISSSDGINSA